MIGINEEKPIGTHFLEITILGAAVVFTLDESGLFSNFITIVFFYGFIYYVW